MKTGRRGKVETKHKLCCADRMLLAAIAETLELLARRLREMCGR